MGIGDFLGSIGDGIKHGLDKTVEGLNVVDRHINPFHEEQTITPGGKQAAEAAAAAGKPQSKGILAPSLEDTMSGMRWLYSNGVSQPIATAALVGKMNRGKNDFFGGDYFSTDAWTKAWNAANHISPGQAFLMNPDEAEHAINSPLLYYKPPESYLPPGFSRLPTDQQQQILKEAGMPAIGNAYVEKMRGHSGWFKYGSGALDFSSIVFLDPTTVGLGVAGKARNLATVDKMPKGGWSEAQIDQIMGKTKMNDLMDGIWANRDNPQLLNNTTLAQHSGMGPRFGAIVSKLQDPEELALFVRTGMGDMRAVDELTLRNAQAAQVLRSDVTRLAALDLMHSRYANFPNQQALVKMEMARINTQIAANTDLVNRYTSIVGDPAAGIPSAEGLLDQLYVNRWSMEHAADRTAAQNAYRTGPAKSGGRPISFTPGRGPLNSVSYEPTPISGGYVHSNLWTKGVGYFTGPVRLVRSLQNMHPNGYMRLDTLDKDSINELRGHLARIPGIREETRGTLLNEYIKATNETERLHILNDVIGPLGAAKVAERYGVSPEIGEELFKKHQELRMGELDNMKRYSAALRSPEDVAAGLPLHVDEFTAQGGKITLSPFTVTRLVNGHTLQDLNELGKVLSRHGSRLETLRVKTGNARDAIEGGADYINYLWKFSTLFRLGYVPRVLGDDLASQWARVGTAAMALRAGRGIKNAFHNAQLWALRPALESRQAMQQAGAEYAAEEMAHLKGPITKLDTFLRAETAQRLRDMNVAQARVTRAQAKVAALSPGDVSAKAKATRMLLRQHEQALRAATSRHAAGASPGKTARLQQLRDQHLFLERYQELALRAAEDYANQAKKVIQGNQAVMIDGKVFPAAFGGKSGDYHRALVSADESVGNLFATNKQLLQGNLERSFDHGGQAISAGQDPIKHAQAWEHAINNQIMQDPLQRMMVAGKIKTAAEAAEWMKTTPQGIAYRSRLPKMLDTDEIAQSAKYEVDQYLHTPEIRMKALEPDGVTADWLQKATPNMVDRPDLHTGRVGQSQLHHAKTLDRVIQKFYKVAATMPANRMSRHPLFNQFYEGHLTRMVKQRKLNGRPTLTVEETENLAHQARTLALRDTRALVFDIAHRSDAAAALRFLSPFFSATTEAFQRWGRVIADKPQTVGYMGNWYNAPAYTGHMQDMDGNSIDGEGYAYLPTWPLKADGTPDYSKKPTVTKRLVPKAERYIVTRVPKWVAESPLGKAFNITEAGGKLNLSQNSINMLTQGDPWFNPGVGPIVQIPVNEFVRDKPRNAELARQLGILPFGVQGGTLLGENPLGRALNLATPAVVRNAITAMDTSDERYQSIKLQILQREIFNFTQEHDGAHPTAAQIGAMQEKAASKTRDYWYFQAASSFLQPMVTTRKDPFQFYRDQYNALRRQNSLTADDEFLSRYGESYFVFAQEVSKSSGIPPTNKAVELSMKYRKELAKTPELAALLIGPEGNGPFSPEAYAYQLNNPLVPGGAEMQRTRLTADEALKENQRRLGWAKYTARMNTLGAQLRSAGFETFTDKGAEEFAARKKAYTSLYAEPLYPDGTPNPFYNEEWSKDFFTQDRRKYDRMIPGLTAIANSPMANEPGRSDLKMLQQYLGGRKALIASLNERKAADLPATLAAQANADLKEQWVRFVDRLIESDTKFGDLYHRYLSRDMGVDEEEEANQ